MTSTEEKTTIKEKKNSRWGVTLVTGLLVSAVCVAILIYVGWFDNNSHVDSNNGDNVTQTYAINTPQPNAPGVNDWNNPYGNSLHRIIVDHAEGTNTTPLPQ